MYGCRQIKEDMYYMRYFFSLILLMNVITSRAQRPFFDETRFWESGVFKTPYTDQLSEGERVAGLSRFWSEAKYNFVNFDLISDVNIDSLYVAYLPRVKAAASTAEYYQLMMEFCALLRDGHTNVYPPKELNDQFYARPLVRCRLIEGKVLVVAILDSALETSGWKLGQEVISVNNLPVKEYAARFVTPYQSASTVQDMEARTYEYSLFAGSLKQPVLVEVQSKGQPFKKLILNRVDALSAGERFRRKAFEFHMLPGNIAYVELGSFANEDVLKGFEARFDEISKAAALIIDVRNNGGGNSAIGWKILSFLTDSSRQVISWYTRDYKPAYRAWRKAQPIDTGINSIEPCIGSFFQRPVILLTSSRTFSAAEDFTAAFRAMNRGLIMGTATAGSTGQPLFIDLPGGGSARICTKRNLLVNGLEFIGKGIQPDRKITESISDIRTGVDPVLNAALRELQTHR